MAEKKEWTKLAAVDEGSRGQPGSQYTKFIARVSRRGDRFKLVLDAEWGSNQGYLQSNGGYQREYRAGSLDELMRIAISAEQGITDHDENMLIAIRTAIYQAEDAI